VDKNVLKKISYGLYIVSSLKNGKFNGQIANSVFQVTAEPVLIIASINKSNLTHEYISSSKIFTISILSQKADFKFIGNFGFKSGRDVDKFSEVNFKILNSGAPVVIEKCSAWLECEVINSFDTPTHTLFLGKLVDSEIIDDSEPLTYDYYQKVIKGKTPPSATTYIK